MGRCVIGRDVRGKNVCGESKRRIGWEGVMVCCVENDR